MNIANRLCIATCLAGALAAMSVGPSDGAGASGTLAFQRSSGAVTISISNGAGPGATSPNDTSSAASSYPDAASAGFAMHTPIDLSVSQSTPGTTSGGGLVWGDPLSTDLVDLGHVHTRLRYFSQTSASGMQNAVGINFSVQY
jgi:hypothetical protein